MNLRLMSLTLDRFKGIHHLSVSFGGHSASIYGANGLGKSSIYDGWLWLITGKDSHGSVPDDTKGFQIKPLDSDGEVADRAAHTSVEAVVEINGQRATLRKEYYERWTRKRGAPEASYDGNTTDYYINDVPRSKREYESWLEERIPLRVFGLLSHTEAFAGMSDSDRRSILFEMASIGDERSLMEREERFAPLHAATAAITLTEYKRQLDARRKRLNRERTDLPARMDEVSRTVSELQDIPFDRLRQSVAELEAEQDELNRQIAGSAAADRDRLTVECSGLRNELAALETENRAHRLAQQGQQPDTASLCRELERLRDSLRYEQDRQNRERRDRERCEVAAEKHREQYREVNREKYAGDQVCPTCGQPLPPDRQKAAREAWEQEKRRRLETIAGEGKRYSDCVKAYAQREEEARAKADEIAALVEQKTGELEQLKAAPAPEITDLPDYASRRSGLEERIRERERALDAVARDEAERTRPLYERRCAVADEITALSRQIAKESLLTMSREREAELREQLRKIAGEMEDCDRMLELMEQFTRYKSEFVTDTINALFSLVEFRLFRQQVNGGLVDCCDILVGGVPYHRGLNTGARVTAGLDMIEALSRHYQASVPVFVDNMESVTDLVTGEGQFIRLYVSEEDRELRVDV